MKYSASTFYLLLITALAACTQSSKINNHATDPLQDVHSFANPQQIAVTHLHLNLKADFEKHVLKGYAELLLNNKGNFEQLFLDTRQLTIDSVVSDNGIALKWQLGKPDELLGNRLAITVTKNIKKLRVYYATTPDSEALQWLNPGQTHDKKHPFLFSQSQAILARTWVPCQDSPGNKFTYTATITCPPHLMALMSAGNDTTLHNNGIYTFEQTKPISTYLLALAIGDFRFKSLGDMCGVYAEPGLLEKAAREFVTMPAMIDSAEALYGPYQWGRYDVLVLPPSFPFGGMENPCLTFATPTIIAGDGSLVSLIAHELAHSWSGNLVTNAIWNDFWLNEGFTVYFEQRIMEKIYGKPYADMLTVLGMGELQLTLKDLKSEGLENDTRLKLDLSGRNPDDGLTDIAYEKGRFFLQTVENVVGREKMDAFLTKYFSTYAYTPMTTEGFIAFLNKELLTTSDLQQKVNTDAWVYGTGLPENCPKPVSTMLQDASNAATLFNKGENAAMLKTKGWTTHHWLYFLRTLNPQTPAARLAQLDSVFKFTRSGNSEILCDWFKLTIDNNYYAADEALQRFLIDVGRRKFLTPLYSRLASTDAGKQKAKEIFDLARPGYHAVSATTIAEMLK